MSKIHILDKALAELIAAGEVVERPASIAKELIENSIDAGATAVTLEIENGGISFLRVTDNGCGISGEDIPKAFLRHATSKISSPKDLDEIKSLGFRGEALASIAAMAKVELTSKVSGDREGVTYTIEGGEEVALTSAGCPDGTIITVRDVFYNTPARMKFLKKDVGEGNAVALVVEKCALSHPGVAFRFVRDGKTRLQTSGSGELLPVIAVIYGKEFADSLIKVHYQLPEDGIAVSGYVTVPSAAKSSRLYQNFFLNSRYIRTRTAAAALDESFKTLIQGGKHPGCVLNIEVVPSLVDVNVHPAKIEVRFANEKPIFHCVYCAVKSAHATTQNGAILTEPITARLAQQKPAVNYRSFVSPKISTTDFQQAFPGSQEIPLFVKPISFTASSPDIYVGKGEGNPSHPNTARPSTNTEQNIYASYDIIEDVNAGKPTQNPTIIEDESAGQGQQRAEKGCVIGEYAGTYILVEQGDSLVLVDKHAAHERILYKRIKEDISHGNRQILLSPITVTLAGEEHSALLDNLDKVEKLGFLAEDFGGNSIVVREVPVELEECDVASTLSDIASKLINGKDNITPQIFERLLFSIACKSAVRAKEKNSLPELDAIVKLLQENPSITHCPHGRPVKIAFSKSDVEKLFGRH